MENGFGSTINSSNYSVSFLLDAVERTIVKHFMCRKCLKNYSAFWILERDLDFTNINYIKIDNNSNSNGIRYIAG